MRDDQTNDSRSIDELAEELHGVLRSLARGALRRTPGGLDATDLVHTAWLNLSRKYDDMPRTEFLALCATIMRRLAVDEARKNSHPARAPERITLSGLAGQTSDGAVDLLELDDALDRLRQENEGWARIVELRFFGGLSGDEVAHLMGRSRRTVTREWTLARAWLKRALR